MRFSSSGRCPYSLPGGLKVTCKRSGMNWTDRQSFVIWTTTFFFVFLCTLHRQHDLDNIINTTAHSELRRTYLSTRRHLSHRFDNLINRLNGKQLHRFVASQQLKSYVESVLFSGPNVTSLHAMQLEQMVEAWDVPYGRGLRVNVVPENTWMEHSANIYGQRWK